MSGLSASQVRTYWERGYLSIPAFVDAAGVARLREECDRLAALDRDAALDTETFPRRTTAGERVRNLIDPIVPRSQPIRELLGSPAIADVLRSLFRDEPRLFKDKLILRPPGSAGYGLHQDHAYYGWTGVAPDDLLAVQIAIDAADAANGALRLHPGAHRTLLEPTLEEGSDIAAAQLATTAELITARPGDALIFHSLTPHSSDANRSPSHRRTLYLTYNAARSGDLYAIYYQDRGDVLLRTVR